MKPTSHIPLFLACIVIAASPYKSNGQEIFEYRDANVQLELMRRPEVLAELEITKQQSDSIAIVVRRRGERFNVDRSQLSVEDQERARQVAWIEQAQLQRDQLDREQLERLDQLRLQYQSLGAFGSTVAETIELTDDQKNRLAAIEEDLGNELRQKMMEFHVRVQTVFQESLTPQQLAKWMAMIGDKFEFESRWPGLSFLISLR